MVFNFLTTGFAALVIVDPVVFLFSPSCYPQILLFIHSLSTVYPHNYPQHIKKYCAQGPCSPNFPPVQPTNTSPFIDPFHRSAADCRCKISGCLMKEKWKTSTICSTKTSVKTDVTRQRKQPARKSLRTGCISRVILLWN